MSSDVATVPRDADARRIVAVVSGKGGGGCSMIAANLAIFLAQIGKRVVLVDANLTSPGLHSWLGMGWPSTTIGDLLGGRVARLEDALSETPVTGLYLLAGARGLAAGEEIGPSTCQHLLAQVRSQEADFVIIDLPSGLTGLGLHVFAEADVPIVLTVPTPDAVESTYRFLVSAMAVRLQRLEGLADTDRELIDTVARDGTRQPTTREMVAALRESGSGRAETVLGAVEAFHPQLLINQVRLKADEGLGEAMVSAATRWLGLVPRLLGSVDWDENVWLSLRRGMPLLIDFPQSRACRGLERVVRQLLGLRFEELIERSPVPPPTEEQNLYEVLEIYPGASEEEVRRALKRIRDLFGVDGLAARGACLPEDGEAYQRLAEEAHATLVDKSRRRAYDRGTFPDGFPAPREPFTDDTAGRLPRAPRPHDSLPRVELTDDQVVDGAFLGEVRRERGVELIDISNRAKISVSYLKALEEERYEDLPAPVYIRGFVTEYARYLKIDPKRAVADFFAKFDEWANKKGR